MDVGIRTLSEQDLRDVTTTKQVQYGAKGITEDGRLFRYVGADSTGLSIGKLVVGPAKVANHENRGLASTSGVAVGATSVSVAIGATAATADQYLEGFLDVVDGTGKGASYRIAGNQAAASSGTLVVTLAEPLTTALATSDTKITVSASPFSSVTHTATLGLGLGVATVAVAASGYGWVLSRGHAAVLSDGIITRGYEFVQSVSVSGAIAISAGNAATSQGLGYTPEATADTKYYPVNFSID